MENQFKNQFIQKLSDFLPGNEEFLVKMLHSISSQGTEVDIKNLPKAKPCRNFLNSDFLMFQKLYQKKLCTQKSWVILFCHLFTVSDIVPASFEKRLSYIRKTPEAEFNFVTFSLSPVPILMKTNTTCNLDDTESLELGCENAESLGLPVIQKSLDTNKDKTTSKSTKFLERQIASLQGKLVKVRTVNKRRHDLSQYYLKKKDAKIKELEEEQLFLKEQVRDQFMKLNEIKDAFHDFQDSMHEYTEAFNKECQEADKTTGDEASFPKINTRDSQNARKVNPAIERAMLVLCDEVKISTNKVIPCIAAVSNIVFNQVFTYKKKPPSKRSKRKDCAADTENNLDEEVVVAGQKRTYSGNCLPSHSLASKLERQAEPIAKRSIAEKILDSENVTFGIDGTDHKRKHIMVSQMVVPEKCDDGSVKTTNYCMDVRQSTAHDAEHVYELVLNILREYGFLKTNNPLESDDLVDTQKKFAKAMRYWCTDGGSEMQPACKLVAQWQESLGVDGIKFLKCLGHLVTGLEGEADRVISSLECKTDQLQEISTAFTESFLDSSNKSLYYTVAYAFLRLVGPSSDSVSYSMTDEFTTYLAERGQTNLFVDIKKSRFGKFFLVGRDLTCLMADLEKFLDEYMKDNKLYESCQFYINNCPYLFETSISLGLLYYHIVYPLMRATGIEGDFYPFTHDQFLVLLPKLQEDLHSLVEDATPLLNATHIKSFSQFSDTGLLKFPEKEETSFKQVFEILKNNDKINKEIVLSLAKTICLKFTFCLERQVGVLYLRGENSEVAKMIKENPEGMKTAAVNNLGCEKRCAQYKALSNANPTAPISFIARRMILPKSPFIINLKNMTNEEYRAEMDWARNSIHVKKYFEFQKLEAKMEKDRQKENLKKLQRNKLELAKKQEKNVENCKLHGGPFNCLESFNAFISENTSTLTDQQLQEILDREIKYQKENLGLFGKTSELYKFYHIHPTTKKHIPIPNTKKCENLRSVLSSAAFSADPSKKKTSHNIAPEKILDSLNDICEFFGTSNSDIIDKCDDQSLQDKFVIDQDSAFMSIYQDGEREYCDWSVGKIRSVTKSRDCSECKRLQGSDDVRGVCMKVRFYEEYHGSKTEFIYKNRSKLWHCRHENVIKNNLNLQTLPGNPRYHLTKNVSDEITLLMKDMEARLS